MSSAHVAFLIMVRRIWLHVISAMSGITHLVKVFQQMCSQIPRSHGCVESAFRGGAAVVCLFLLYYNLS